jgi:hypothetical protein
MEGLVPQVRPMRYEPQKKIPCPYELGRYSSRLSSGASPSPSVPPGRWRSPPISLVEVRANRVYLSSWHPKSPGGWQRSQILWLPPVMRSRSRWS